jgi:TRAP-type mannitol/chloroaromatic compound transport system permease small subunit
MTTTSPDAKPQPSAAYLGIIRTIDTFTEWVGYLFLLISIPLILANFVEVISRYVFDDPTIWALDITTMAFGAMVMLGTAPALVKGAHVRTDMLWDKFSDRKKGLIDTIGFAVFFLPTMAVLFFISIDDFLYALDINERSNSGAWGPALWPLRAIIPVTAALLFVQGISELMKSWWAARTGEFLVKHEKIEV